MKKFFIKLLFKLIDRGPKTKDEVKEKIIQQWLTDQFEDIRVREYINYRDTSILRQIGYGLSRDDYLIWVGRRLEVLDLLNSINNAGKVKERNKNK
ncbi:MAG TPA: hypothetical protein PLC43_04880 [Caldisericia bacterium]|nr:hypothetical protein [Caldisericia bacterium]